YAMTLSELGVERTAFHSTLQSCEGGAPMSTLCATGPYRKPGQIVEGQGSFLALMMLGQMSHGSVLTPTVSGSGTVMVHGVLGDDGSLSLLVVDLRDPATKAPLPVRITRPTGLPDDAPAGWRVRSASQLSGSDLADPRSTLSDLSEAGGELRTAQLGAGAPMTVSSSPGTATLLELKPAPLDQGKPETTAS